MIWKRVGRWPDDAPVRRDLVRCVDTRTPNSPKQHPRCHYEQTLASVAEMRGSSGQVHAFVASLTNGKAVQLFYTWPEAKAWCDAEVALVVLAEAA